jgi:pyrimidine operon attenuation protein/uracil phosphoribosyltransferase
MPAGTAQLVLDERQIRQKIARLAFEIYERNFEEPHLFIAGIRGQGQQLAQLLTAQLKEISPLNIIPLEVSIDKQQPHSVPVKLNCDPALLVDQVVILVDDVLNTGRTLAYGLKPFLEIPLRKLETVVLIDRGYASFPLQATYVGYRLATTLQDHVEVAFREAQPEAVWLQ